HAARVPLAIERSDDIDGLEQIATGALQRRRESLGVGRRKAQSQAAVRVFVDADRQDVKSRRGARAGAVPADDRPRRLRRDQVLGIVHHDLDLVVALVELQRALQPQQAARGRAAHRLLKAERHAVDAPLDPADAAAAVVHLDLDRDLILRGRRAFDRTYDPDLRDGTARQHFAQIEGCGGGADLALWIAG